MIILKIDYQPENGSASCTAVSMRSRSEDYVTVTPQGDEPDCDVEITIRPTFDPNEKRGIEALLIVLDLENGSIGAMALHALLNETFVAGVEFAKNYPQYT